MACSGSGTTWNCTSGSTAADVQGAVNAATNGATITLANGSYTWSGTVAMPSGYGVTITCATVGGCSMTNSASPWFDYSASGTVPFLLRVSGLNIQQSVSGGFVFWLGDSCPSTCTYQKIRIDHNAFTYTTSGLNTIQIGDSAHNSRIYGVVDHNTFTCNTSCAIAVGSGAGEPSPPVSALGTINNLFFEDNTISVSNANVSSGLGCLDGWGSVKAYVARHNTSLNCLWTSHGMDHAGGMMNYEVYNNKIQMDTTASAFTNCTRCFHHQGSGTIVAFNNSFTPATAAGHASSPISITHYRAYESGPSIDGFIATCNGSQAAFSFSGMTVTDGNRSPSGSNYGYPCWRQPGRDFQANYAPMFFFNNFWTDDNTQANVGLDDVQGGTVPNGSFPPNNCTLGSTGNCDYISFHLKYNREAYQAVSASAQSSATAPFNGTTGMGFGTLSNRPLTCTTNATESGAGVMYAAGTTAGTIGASSGSGANTDYAVYTCSATNTWTPYYTPFTYPHPLVNSGLVPPSNLHIVSVARPF